MKPNPYKSPREMALNERPKASSSDQAAQQTHRVFMQTGAVLVIAAGVSHALGEDSGAAVLLGGAMAMLCFNRSCRGASHRTRIALFSVGALCIILGGIVGLLLSRCPA